MSDQPDTDGGGELIRLSSRSTTFWKRVFTPLWSGSVGVVALLAWLDMLGSPPVPTPAKWVLLLLWIVFTPLFVRWFGGLRNVWLDGDVLMVDHPRRGIRMPLGDVVDVEESRFQRVKTITLRLRHRTPAGDRLVFPAPLVLQQPFSDHPVVALLKERGVLGAGEGGRLLG